MTSLKEYIAFVNDDDNTIVVGRVLQNPRKQKTVILPICSMGIIDGKVWGMVAKPFYLSGMHIAGEATSFTKVVAEAEKTRKWMIDRYPGEYDEEVPA